MHPSPEGGDGNMKRAIFVALTTGLAITSAAALDIAGSNEPAVAVAVPGTDVVGAQRVRDAARAGQREQIQARYVAEREQCAALRGYQREKCVVKAHARKGRSLLEAAAPYESRL
jgi:hypothetical protein